MRSIDYFYCFSNFMIELINTRVVTRNTQKEIHFFRTRPQQGKKLEIRIEARRVINICLALPGLSQKFLDFDGMLHRSTN